MRPECVEKNYISCKLCPEYKTCPDADPLYKKKSKKIMDAIDDRDRTKRVSQTRKERR